MRKRCNDPGCNGFEYYGGRGIKVCASWRDSFTAFLADMGERPAGTTLDRIDNDVDYEPGNCRWATALEQRHNRRDSSWPALRDELARVGERIDQPMDGRAG